MADVSIKVTADTSQAAQRLGQVRQSLSQIYAEQQHGRTGLPVGFRPNGALGGAAPLAPAVPVGGMKGVAAQIGVAAGGFLVHEGVQSLATWVGSQEGGARQGRRIAHYGSDIGGGALAGAALGATVGSAIPGLGTAVGAGVGALFGAASGAIKAFTEDAAESAKTLRESRQALAAELRAVGRGQAVGEQDRAFMRLLGTRNRDEQLAMVENRIETLRNGDGEYSIERLRRRRSALENAEQTDTEEYRIVKETMGLQLGRLSALLRTREELSLSPTGGMLRAKEVTDRLGAIGGTVGPQVDVADVNRRQLDVLERILEAVSRKGLEDVSDAHTLNAAADAATFG